MAKEDLLAAPHWPPDAQLVTALGPGRLVSLNVNAAGDRDKDDDTFLCPRLLTDIRG